MENYKANSHLSRSMNEPPETITVEKVISGTATKKRKSELKKIGDLFVSEDAKNIKSYVLVDVLIPTIKKAISEIISNGIDIILYGENAPSKPSVNNSGKIPYRNFYDAANTKQAPNRYARADNQYNYDEISVDTMREAKDVLNKMHDIVNRYGIVSVANMYDLVGETANYTDYDYGWTDLRSATVYPYKGRFCFKLPKALPLH